MTYAPATRPFYDADSHVMELPNFLRDFADPKLRDEIALVNYNASLVTDEEVAIIMQQGGKHSAEHVAELDNRSGQRGLLRPSARVIARVSDRR